MAVVLDRPSEIRGPAPYPVEWQWALREDRLPRSLAPALLIATGLLGLLAVSGLPLAERRPRPATRVLLLAATVLGTGLSLAMLGLEPGGAMPTLTARVLSGTYTSYHSVAVSPAARDPIELLRHYTELLPTFRDGAKHAATHPPGPILFFRGLIALCDGSPVLTDALLRAAGYDATRPVRPPNTPASKAAALLGGLLLTVFGTAACWPIAALSERLTGDALAGARAGLLWQFVPGPTLLVPHLDQAVALPVAGAAALLAAALAAGSRRLAVTAGLLGGLAVFLSYGAAVFLSIAGLAVVLAAASEAAALRRLSGLATIAVASGAAVIGATVLLGHSPLQAARVALGIHRDSFTAVRSYPLWLLFNPVDLAIFLGVPVAVLAAGRVIAAVRASFARPSRPADRFAAALALGLGLLWLSGTTRGEVGRLWIPLMPLLLVAALGHRAEEREAGPSSGEATVLGVVLCAWCFVLRMSWEL